jgi:signal transduction histidine kinase
MQAEKMAAVGQLAGGIAHEINNPLGVILGFAQGLDRRTPAESPAKLPTSSIVREALRCRNLVQELLTFSRTGRNSMEPLDLGRVIRDTVPLIDARARTQGVVIETRLDAPSIDTVGNATQLQQILVNLGINALDAMKTGGKLSFHAFNDGGATVIEVSDTGTGISDSVKPHIFEPFFTTKSVGEGTGLGLSLVYEIVKQHQGDISVDSTEGHGTVFHIRLPASQLAQAA